MADPDPSVPLASIVARLVDIAGCVASETEAATSAVRGLSDHAGCMAALAAGLQGAAEEMEASVRQQADALALARAALSENRPVIDALEQSVAGVASISAAIAAIAQESRVLSLNARIEAARADTGGSAFAVVAAGMSTLATRTKSATDQIRDRAASISHDVGSANQVAAAHALLVAEQAALLSTSLDNAERQRDTADELTAIIRQAAGTVDRAASAIGRVGAHAVAVKLLARQLSRLPR